MSLRDKTISGLFWTILDTFLLRGLSFLSTIVLARWIGPADFGLIGMIAVFIAIGTTIMDSGMAASLIRMENPVEQDFSTVFILNILMSLTFYLLIFCAAPYISQFYNQPILVGLLRLYGLSFIIGALSSVQLAILNRKMQFKRIMKQNMPGTLIGVTVGIILGYLGYGVWSVVIMYLVTQSVQSLVLWIRSDWKPSFSFSRVLAKVHFNFGYKLMLSSLLSTIYQNIYNIIIGKYYSPKELGYFERSRAFNDYPVNILTSVMSKVTYPLLSSIRADKQRTSEVYRMIMRTAFFVTCPLMFSLAAIAHPLFKFALGDQWLPAVPFFQVLCLASIFYPIHSFNLNVFKVFGRSELFLKLELLKKGVVTVCLLVGFQFGILGLVWSSVIGNYIGLFINTYYSADLIHYSMKRQFLDMFPTIFTASLMFVVTYFLIGRLGALNSFEQVIIGLVCSSSTYLGVSYLIKAEPLRYTINILSKRKLTI